MILTAAAALALIPPTLAFANVGDTRAESETRYGVKGIEWNLDKEDNGMVMYHPSQDWAIQEWYNAQGVVEGITYFRLPNNTPMTIGEIKKLVLENGGVDPNEWALHCDGDKDLCGNGCDFVYQGKSYRYANGVSGRIGYLFHNFTIGTPEGFKHLNP